MAKNLANTIRNLKMIPDGPLAGWLHTDNPLGLITEPGDPDIIVPGVWWEANQNVSVFDPRPGDFTQLTPAGGARLIHVSPSGSPTGLGTAGSPISNIDTALNMLRDNAGDWILFESRNDYTWDLYSNFRRQKCRAGVGFGWYGIGPRPRVIPPETLGYTYNTDHKWIGLHLVNPYGEIGNPLFDGNLTFRNLQYLANGAQNILVEDCESTGVELLFQRQAGPHMGNFKVRHHIGHYVFWGNSSTSNTKRPSASYVNSIENMLFEYNFHDYSGWHPLITAGYNGLNITGAGANQFNHCYYMGEGAPFAGPTIRHCFISRPSSHGWQQRSGGIAEDNLVYYAAVGGAFGYYDNKDLNKGILPDGRIARMQRNLFLRGHAMYRLPLSCQNNVCSSALWGLQYTLKSTDAAGAIFESLDNIVAETSDAYMNHATPPGFNRIREVWQQEGLYTGTDPTGGRVTRSGNKYWHFSNATEGDGQFVAPGRSIESHLSGLLGSPVTYDQAMQVYKSRPKNTLRTILSIPTIHAHISGGYEEN